MKRITLTLLASFLTPFSANLYAQGAASAPAQGSTSVPAQGSSTSIPSQGATIDPSVTPTQGTVVNPSVTPAQTSANAQSAQANAAQANPAQTREQATGGGVFGPSAGPGIFGPASQTQPATTTDIYGNQQPASGVTTQPAQPSSSTQGQAAQRSQRPGQANTPTVYDANGNPLPSNTVNQGQLPRDLNPQTPNTAQPSTGAASGTMTGR